MGKGKGQGAGGGGRGPGEGCGLEFGFRQVNRGIGKGIIWLYTFFIYESIVMQVKSNTGDAVV